jgi:hypothetical protein
MTEDGEEWARLQAAWRAQPMPDDAAARYRARAARERRSAFAEAALESTLALACAAAFAWWAGDMAGVERVILIVLALGSIASVPVALLMRRALWQAYGDTMAGHVAFLRRRARLGLWFARFGYLGGPLGAAVGAALAGLGDFSILPEQGRGALIALGVAGLIAGCWWSVRKARGFQRSLAELHAADAHDPQNGADPLRPGSGP